MEKSKFQLILLITTLICLISLFGIQINWILKEARLQETQFNRSVGLALRRIENNLEKYKNCALPEKCKSCKLLTATLSQVANVDSIIKSDLNYYGINLDFDYNIIDIKDEKGITTKNSYITENLANKLQQSGYELKINFPKKRDFIIAQIGTIFIASIILVVLVTVSFLLIFRYYRKEREISSQIRDFINNMTHEFNTPLTNIGFANSMLQKSELIEKDQRLASYTGIIRDEQKRLKERVELLLKSSQGYFIQPANKEELDLFNVLDGIVETFKAQLDDRNGKIILNRVGDDFSYFGNIDQLHIIFVNLIDNAIKYCEIQPEITINIKSKPERFIVEIVDNGIGIPNEHLPRIFDRFYRVSQGNLHDTKGFGLGLCHVKSIVDSLGGKISASSSKGKGSTFTVELNRVMHD